MDVVILNGEFVKRTSATIDIEDRGYQFGDGIYEVIRVYNGKMFTADEHLDRLFASAEKLQMKLNYNRDELRKMFQKLIEKNKLQLGIVYVQVTRGVRPREHAFSSTDQQLTFAAYTKAMARPEKEMFEGVRVITTEDIRWLRCDIKSLNLLGNVMAKQQAKEKGCFEAVQHRDNIVTEGSSANVSIVKDNTIYTHPANNLILNGITRQKMIEICKNNGIPLVEKTFTVEQLMAADEIFLTGTTTEIMPITHVDNKVIGNGQRGVVTEKLQQLFEQEIIKQCQST